LSRCIPARVVLKKGFAMTTLRNVIRFVAPLALLSVSACAQNFNARVNRFQAMPAPQGQSFFVKSDDAKLAGGLEFSQYAGLVAQRLTGLGYSAAPSADKASLVVTLAYGVDQGKDKIRSTPSFNSFGSCFGYYDPWCRGLGYGSFGSPYAWRGGRYAYGFYDPFLFGSGFNNDIESYTVFTSDLTMKIEKNGSGERVFEGNAKAMSLNDNLTYLVPNLINAMFTGFPGNSGETVKITVAPPKRGS
jgi:Domain of unknown function (DUF4136)